MRFDVIASTPPGFPGTRLVKAAYRAGYTGAVALEYSSLEESRSILQLLGRTETRFSISIGPVTPELLECIDSNAGALTQVIITDAQSPSLQSDISTLRTRGFNTLVQVSSVEETLLAQTAGADGLIVKGNESGGIVGEETSFILLQHVLPRVSIPVFARGGIGLYTASACFAAGAVGVVLDWQLALCEESELPDAVKSRIAALDGSETVVIGPDTGPRYRVYSRAEELAYFKLEQDAQQTHGEENGQAWVAQWKTSIETRTRDKELLLIGQDAAFAQQSLGSLRTASAICHAIRREAIRQSRVAAHLDVLREGGPLATSNNTRHPILQGPMTRVSDQAQFALPVADAGGLPFLALGLMRGPELGTLLRETAEKLGSKPWGFGILGFTPNEVWNEQLGEALKYSPPFAIIAGGRPDQAKAIERHGIRVYLHVPSPELLRQFLSAGTRRVIFEGRECGGHVGPRTSFVLWESMVRVILEHLDSTGARHPEDYQVVFAGGIISALSAAMVGALVAPLSERGLQVGVLMGTAYLFTKEAVSTGAITKGFQREAISCNRTALLASGVGHVIRCASTPLTQSFNEQKRQLAAEGRSKDEIRETLESLTLGRLRVAAKGITRAASLPDGRPTYESVGEQEQHRDGMYMMGQAAFLRETECTIEELHHDVSSGGDLLKIRVQAHTSGLENQRRRSQDIAIIGISCVFPRGNDFKRYWQNILARVSAISEIPKDRFDLDLYFDSRREARDKIYSRWGGFLEDIPFEPMRFGMPPASIPSIEPAQLLTLELVRSALKDAGYLDRRFERDRTAVVVGTGGGTGELGLAYSFRSLIPQYLARNDADAELIGDLEQALPEWTEDSFAGILPNVAAGRIANRFDIGGTNYIVDAACASSLAALRLGVNELTSHSSEVAIVAGVEMNQSTSAYLGFAKTHALSPTGQCHVFDQAADGTVISEGIGVTVLKRLDDAIRDGDRIYAVLKGVGASSDGKDKGLTAPRPIGQIRALDRAYQSAGISASTIGLIEAHGTGTVVGDRTEVESLATYFMSAGAQAQSCAIGSVKSMIGHTKCAAGFAGLIKAALALHHKILPPTIGVSTPNPKIDFPASAFYVNTDARPWLQRLSEEPRRAGVSAFGFGGTNFHAVLEEYKHDEVYWQSSPAPEWPVELFLWRGASPDEILAAINSLQKALADGAEPRLNDLAAAVYWEYGRRSGSHCLAIVADSITDLAAKIEKTRETIARETTMRDVSGIYYATAAAAGKIAFLFPGQGSQRVDMLKDLSIAFPTVREVFEEADKSLGLQLGQPLSSFVFPIPAFKDDERNANDAALKQTLVAQPALGAAGIAMYRLLTLFGVEPDLVAGHSYGELVALCAAGAISFDDLIRISEARGRLMLQSAPVEPGIMAAVDGPGSEVAQIVAGIEGAFVANFNGPRQTVISGTQAGVNQALKQLADSGIPGRAIPVACAFHSPLMSGALQPFREVLEQCPVKSPRLPVFSNSTAAPHSNQPAAVRDLLAGHIIKPVLFADEVLAMYDAGARIFIEVGPGKVLTPLVSNVLGGRQFTAIHTDQPARNGLVSFVHSLAQLAVAGLRFSAYRQFEDRIARTLKLDRLVEETKPVTDSATAWIIRSGQAIPPQSLRTEKRLLPRQKQTPLAAKPDRASFRTEIPSHQNSGNGSLAPKNESPAMPMPAPARGDHLAKTMQGYHQLMTTLIENESRIMQAFLQAASGADGADRSAPQDFFANTAGQRPRERIAPRELGEEATRAEETNETPSAEPPPLIAFTGGEDPRPQLTYEIIIARLVEIVSVRTGYPSDMIDVDLELEADLGVDSIKRIEILGALRTTSLFPSDGADEMEQLSKQKTLRAIADWIVTHANGAGAPQARAESAVKPEIAATPNGAERPINRLLVKCVDAPIPTATVPLGSAHTVLITEDGDGVAEILLERLGSLGINAQLIAAGDVSDAALKPPVILVHLTPLAKFINAEQKDFHSRLDRELRSFVRLVQRLEPQLREGGSLLAATRLGGSFAVGVRDMAPVWPGSGAISGFIKTMAREWPDANCRTVDFESNATAEHIAQTIIRELTYGDGLTEVGYQNGHRLTLHAVAAPLEPGNSRLHLDSDSVVLVTGGARGITAQAALELARLFQLKLILVGRTPLCPDFEMAGHPHVEDERAVKGVLAKQMESAGVKPTPALVGAEYRKLNRQREICANVDAMRRAGSIVEYHAADVGDDAVFQALIETVYERFGRIDGVIHGAGVIEDKLIGEKSMESFDRVLQPKVGGALTLLRNIRAASLRFLVFYSSVAARYGSRGQADYAAANEVLNKMAEWLNAGWPGRVLAINWGPWAAEQGMVTPELQRQFNAAGVRLVPTAAGSDALIQELRYGRKEDAEVIWVAPPAQD